MRILIVNCTFPRDPAVESGGGGTVVAYELASALVARGHQVAVFTSDLCSSASPYAISEYQISGIHVAAVNEPEGTDVLSDPHYYNPRINEPFRQAFLAHRPHVVHFHALQGIGLSVIPMSKALGAATIVTTHDWWWFCPYFFLCKPKGTVCADDRGHVVLEGCDCAPSEYLRRRRQVALAIAPQVDLFLTTSEYARQSMIGLGLASADRIAVNANGLNVDHRSSLQEVRTPLTFGYLGGFQAAKGYETLLDAFTSLSAEHRRRARLLMYGMLPRSSAADKPTSSVAPSQSSLVSLVSKFFAKAREDPGLALRASFNYIRHRTLLMATIPKIQRASSARDIELRPPYGPAERDRVFDELDVLVIPSLARESYSLVAREAFLRGRPVVATRCGGPEEILKDGVNGILVDAGDVAGLRNALERLIDSPSLVGRLASGASNTLITSIDEQVDQLELHYETLRETAPAGPTDSASVTAQPTFTKTRNIGGQRHTYVVRADGFSFYLNDFFLHCLLDRPNPSAQAVGEIWYGKDQGDYYKAEEVLNRLGLLNGGSS